MTNVDKRDYYRRQIREGVKISFTRIILDIFILFSSEGSVTTRGVKQIEIIWRYLVQNLQVNYAKILFELSNVAKTMLANRTEFTRNSCKGIIGFFLPGCLGNSKKVYPAISQF